MKKLRGEDKAGLYFTVIFHLVVIIVLLVVQIGYALRKENSFVLDFSKQEEIERQQREEVFKPFREVRDLTTGDGLGLPICKQMAMKMNGDLEIDPAFTKGVRFVLHLTD